MHASGSLPNAGSGQRIAAITVTIVEYGMQPTACSVPWYKLDFADLAGVATVAISSKARLSAR